MPVTPSSSTPNGTTAPEAFRSSGAPGSASATTNSSPAAGSSLSSQNKPSSISSPGVFVPQVGQRGYLVGLSRRAHLVSVNGTATARFTLTAHGGPVSGYSVTVGSTLAGHITVSPSSGSLASGASVTITVTSTSLVALDGQLTVNPGGQTITVLLSVGL